MGTKIVLVCDVCGTRLEEPERMEGPLPMLELRRPHVRLTGGRIRTGSDASILVCVGCIPEGTLEKLAYEERLDEEFETRERRARLGLD